MFEVSILFVYNYSEDLGGRFRTLATNIEAFLLNRQAVQVCIEPIFSDHANALKTILADKDFNFYLDQAAFPYLFFRLVLDDLHSCFSGRRTYGQIRAQLREVADCFDETVARVSKVKDLLEKVGRKTHANRKASKAVTELQLVFDACDGNQKRELNRKLVSAIEEMRKKFDKDAEHFHSLCEHLDHNETLEWTNRRAGNLLFSD